MIRPRPEARNIGTILRVLNLFLVVGVIKTFFSELIWDAESARCYFQFVEHAMVQQLFVIVGVAEWILLDSNCGRSQGSGFNIVYNHVGFVCG